MILPASCRARRACLAAAFLLALAAWGRAASVLDLRNGFGNTLAGGYLTETDTACFLSVRTTQAGLDSLFLRVSTSAAADTETYILSDTVHFRDAIIYTLRINLSIGPAAAGGRTEASAFDTLTLRWANPLDSADTVSKSFPVRPSPRQAGAWFSTRADGADTVAAYTGTEADLHFIVADQASPAGVQAQAVFLSLPFSPGQGVDTETVALVPVPGRPGIYSASLPVNLTDSALAGDGRLRLGKGRSVRAIYRDPVDLDSAAIQAAFGDAPDQVEATLQFTDKHGVPLPDGVYFSPAEGRLHLAYRDDWAGGSVDAKEARLVIASNGGLSPADTETVILALDSSLRNGETGTWKGGIHLKDIGAVAAFDGIATIQVLGRITVRAVSHRGDGSASDQVADSLLSALPETAAVLRLEDVRGSGFKVSQASESLIARVESLNLTTGVDTLSVMLHCKESGDTLKLELVENAAMSGDYASAPISKRIGAARADDTLDCKAMDVARFGMSNPIHAGSGWVEYELDGSIGIVRPSLPIDFRLKLADGFLRSPLLIDRPPLSIACFDPLGVFSGWALPTPEPGAWRLPRREGPMVLDFRWADGSRARRLVRP